MSDPSRVGEPGWKSKLTQVLGVALGVGLIFYGLQFRSEDLSERMSPSVAEEKSQPDTSGLAPKVVPDPDASLSPMQAPTVPVQTAEVPRVDEGSLQEPPARVMEWVSLKILADPREGVLKVGTRLVEVGGRIEMTVGEHRFDFRGPEWEIDCVATLTSATSRIKFVKDTGQCEVR